jgi:hypothetical protein
MYFFPWPGISLSPSFPHPSGLQGSTYKDSDSQHVEEQQRTAVAEIPSGKAREYRSGKRPDRRDDIDQYQTGMTIAGKENHQLT